MMGDRHKLVLKFISASEEDKNEARRLAWGACGSWERFYKALEEAAKRGWANSDGLTEAGRQRLARYQAASSDDRLRVASVSRP